MKSTKRVVLSFHSCKMTLVVIYLFTTILVWRSSSAISQDKPAEPAFSVNKEKKSVTIACKMAPRKLPNLTEVYPIEVIATLPSPEGKKAHETVVTYSAKPSEIHAALVGLGLKPGKPALGEDAAAVGPELRISLEAPGLDGKPRVMPNEKALVDRK